jgi:hypothetical protein
MTPQKFAPEIRIDLVTDVAPVQVTYRLLADVVLVVHLGVILFLVGGLLLIIAGNRFTRWTWINSSWFRIAHLITVAAVVFQAWVGQVCSLTTLESWLRERGGASGYERGFIEYWVQWLIFYQAPIWVFTIIYTVFGLLVAIAWWVYPPRWCRGKKGDV